MKLSKRMALVPLSKRAANYVEKRKEESGNITYIYSKEHIEKRNKGKMKRLKKLNKSLSKLRSQIRKDLKSEDEKTKFTALAVALIDETYERVGNPGSAKEMKHYGVTTWLKKHFTFSKGTYKIKYVGKSGVKQEKEVTEKGTVSVLKELLEDKKDSHKIFDREDYKINADAVNVYLKDFKISAKDIRGLHANEEMRAALKKVRKGRLPSDDKEKTKKLKEEFKEALEIASGNVGHEPGTLKNQYLIPTIEPDYMNDGKIGTLASQEFRLSKRAEELSPEEVREIIQERPLHYFRMGWKDSYPDLAREAAKKLAEENYQMFFQYGLHWDYPEYGEAGAKQLADNQPDHFFHYHLQQVYPNAGEPAARNLLHSNPGLFFREGLHKTYSELGEKAAHVLATNDPFEFLNLELQETFPNLLRLVAERMAVKSPTNFFSSGFEVDFPDLGEKAAKKIIYSGQPNAFFRHLLHKTYPKLIDEAIRQTAINNPLALLNSDWSLKYPKEAELAAERLGKQNSHHFFDMELHKKYPNLAKKVIEDLLLDSPGAFFYNDQKLYDVFPEYAKRAAELTAEYDPDYFLESLDEKYPEFIGIATWERDRLQEFSTLISQENFSPSDVPIEYVYVHGSGGIIKRQLPSHGEVGNWIHVVNVGVGDLKSFIDRMENLDGEIAASDSEDLLLHTRGEGFLALSFYGPAVAVFDEDVYSEVDKDTGRRYLGNMRGAQRTEAWINPSKLKLTSVVTNVPKYRAEAEKLGITTVFTDPEALIAPVIEKKRPDYSEKFYQKWKGMKPEEGEPDHIKRTRELGYSEYADDKVASLKLSKRANKDPASRTADSLYKIIEFAFYRVPPNERKRFLSRLRGKVVRLNPSELSINDNKPDSAISQSMAFAKGMLSGLNPAFVQKVIAELTQKLNTGIVGKKASLEVGEIRHLITKGPVKNGANNVPEDCVFTTQKVVKLEKTGSSSQRHDCVDMIDGFPVRAAGDIYVINTTEDYRKLQTTFPLGGFPVRSSDVDYVGASQYYSGIHVTANAQEHIPNLKNWKPDTTAWIVMGCVKPIDEDSGNTFLSKREFQNSVDYKIVGDQLAMAQKIEENLLKLSKRTDLTILHRSDTQHDEEVFPKYDEEVFGQTFKNRVSYQKDRLVKLAKKKEKHTGAMLALMAPKEVCKKLKGIVDEDTVSSDGLHLTLLYLGKAKDLDKPTVKAIERAVEKVCARHDPLEMKISGMGHFTKGEDGTPVYVVPNAHGLSRLQAELEDVLGNLVELNSEHGWVPHMTIGYAAGNRPKMPKLDEFPEWTADTVRFQMAGEKAGEFKLGATEKKACLLSKRARHSFSKCMDCDEPPTHECVWADGRARAWFCDKHWKKFNKKTNDIVKHHEVEGGKVGKKYNKAFLLSKNAEELAPAPQSPNVVIEPYEPAVNNAVSKIKSMDPSLFNNVTKIVVHPGTSSGQLGHVEMGPDKDPREIHLFRDRIQQIVKQQLGGQADQKAIEEAVERALMEVITHEIGHIGRSRTQEQILEQPFGDEAAAERQSQEFMGRLSSRQFTLSKRALEVLPEGNWIKDLGIGVKSEAELIERIKLLANWGKVEFTTHSFDRLVGRKESRDRVAYEIKHSLKNAQMVRTTHTGNVEVLGQDTNGELVGSIIDFDKRRGLIVVVTTNLRPKVWKYNEKEQDSMDHEEQVLPFLAKVPKLQTVITPTPSDKPIGSTLPGYEHFHGEIGNNPQGLFSVPLGMGGGGR